MTRLISAGRDTVSYPDRGATAPVSYTHSSRRPARR